MKTHWLKIDSDPKTSPKSDVTDIELILRTARGDEHAFESLYSLYYGRLYRFVFRIKRGNLDDIEEIINDAMFVVWGKAETYNQRCRPSTWIFGIAYNKARKYFKLPTETISWDDGITNEYTIPVDNDLWLEKLEMQNWLEAAFETLSPEQRAVIELSYFHGMRYDEIARIMDCPPNTVKTRMFHARKKLGAELKNR